MPIFVVYALLTVGWYLAFLISQNLRFYLLYAEDGANWVLSALVICIVFAGMIMMRETLKLRNTYTVAVILGFSAPMIGFLLLAAIGCLLTSRNILSVLPEMPMQLLHYVQETWFIIFPCGLLSAVVLSRRVSDKPSA